MQVLKCRVWPPKHGGQARALMEHARLGPSLRREALL